MKISFNWLRTLIDTGHSPAELADILTSTGLEVESTTPFETVKGGLKGLVTGLVTECVKHPDADRLSLTKVDVGNGEPLSIVCGAPNVAAGQKVIVATVGTILYPTKGEPFVIKKSKIRGAVSEGMICAEDEIGTGESHEGILVLPAETPVGSAASELFNVENDTVFEIGLTPNRGDAASHLGVGRDLAAVLNSTEHTRKYAVSPVGIHVLPDPRNDVSVPVKITDRKGCRRYSAIVISGITVQESPAWLQSRLRSVGVRPINNVVDITNFVLHELGQPLHAFDVEKIGGSKINVRCAYPGETLVTLDHTELKLRESDLMICDAEQPLCLAGIIGGEGSGVTAQTKSVFLESACFDPDYIRASARRHGIRTEASFRFERGSDPEITVMALMRAANLVLEIAGGHVAMDLQDLYPEKLEPYKVAFSYTNCIDLIGKDIDRHHIKNILLNLGMEIDSEGTDGLLLRVPRYRADVTREADVIEEVMRIFGYNNVEAGKHISYTVPHEPAMNAGEDAAKKTAALLGHLGFSEIIGLSLSNEKYYGDDPALVKLVNPLSSELGVLRADMLYNGLDAIAYNVNRKNADLKFFEFGSTYAKSENGKYRETQWLSLLVTGKIFRQNPYGLDREADFGFLKSVVSEILDRSGLGEYKSAESENKLFTYGLSYSVNKNVIADLGSVSPAALKKCGVDQQVFHARIDWERFVKATTTHKIQFEEIPKYPSVRRDLALLLDRSVNYGQVEDLAFATERKILKEVNLFDIYEDKKLGNKKSYAVSFTLLSEEATLTDKQIDATMSKLIDAYKTKLGAELR